KDKGAAAPTEEIVGEGLEADKPFIKVLCETQADLAERVGKEAIEIPLFVDYQQDAFDAVEDYATARLTEIFSIADKQSREAASDEYHQEDIEALAGDGKPFELRIEEIVIAFSA